MGGEERKKRRAGERGGEVRFPRSKFLDPPLALIIVEVHSENLGFFLRLLRISEVMTMTLKLQSYGGVCILLLFLPRCTSFREES